jgi:hypothetical protein
MRRHLTGTAYVGVLLLLTAVFAGAQDQPKKKAETNEKAPNYYPIEVGNTWYYRVDANGKKVNVSSSITEVEQLDGVKSHKLQSLQNEQMHEHLKRTDKGLFRHRANGNEVTPAFMLLPASPKVGAKWAGEFSVAGEKGINKFSAEIQKEETIEVPAGKFKTLRVLIKLDANGNKVDSVYWFAKDVGFVKQRVDLKDTVILLELEKFERKK